MSKLLIGVIVGGILGAFDGLSALISSPDTAPQIVGIVMGSTLKGIIAGVATGFFARKYESLPVGIAFGLGIGGLLATGVALLQHGYYLQIILPGATVGAIAGFATQRYGARVAGPKAAPRT